MDIIQELYNESIILNIYYSEKHFELKLQRKMKYLFIIQCTFLVKFYGLWHHSDVAELLPCNYYFFPPFTYLMIS
jgi:hypothetical protein